MGINNGYLDSEYLVRLGAVLENVKRTTYERMHFAQGSRVLDVGCGPGTDTLPMGTLVGEWGRVFGVDKDAAVIAGAQARAASEGVEGWVWHKVAEAADLPFERNYFDAVRAEQLFSYLPDPRPSFREMVRVTRPGGYLVVLETDFASASIALDEHELERRFTRVLLEHGVKNGYAAREMPLLFQQHNFDEVDLEIVPVLYTDYPVARQLGRWDAMERIALELDLLNKDELEHLRASCERASDEGGFFLHVNMVMVAGRKPLELGDK